MKKWLQENKIYFETLATLSLSIMAILISVVSITLNNRQIEIEEKLHNPIIKVSNEIFSHNTDNSEEKDSHFVIVENDGFHIKEFEAKIYSFLRVEADKYINEERTHQRQEIYIPIDDYFSGSSSLNDSQGVLKRFMGLNNYKNFNELEEGFNIKYREKIPLSFVSLEIYLKMNYQTFNDKKVEKIYKVEFVNEGFEIEENQKLEELLNEDYDYSPESLYSLKPEKIADLIINGKK